MLYPYKPIIISSINIIDNDNNATTPAWVYAGDYLYYETNYMKTMPIFATVQRYLVGEHIITLPPYNGKAKQGEGSSINQLKIPEFTDPGTYYLFVEYNYEIGSFPTRRLMITAKSGNFQVLNRTLSNQKILVENNAVFIERSDTNKARIDNVAKSVKALERRTPAPRSSYPRP
jgi:hypothetical protein